MSQISLHLLLICLTSILKIFFTCVPSVQECRDRAGLSSQLYPSAPGTVLSSRSIPSAEQTQGQRPSLTILCCFWPWEFKNCCWQTRCRQDLRSVRTQNEYSQYLFSPLSSPQTISILLVSSWQLESQKITVTRTFYSGLKVLMSFLQTDFTNRRIICLFNFHVKSFTEADYICIISLNGFYCWLNEPACAGHLEGLPNR